MAGIYSSCAQALQALADGPGEFACHDYDTVREVVLCDAWHRIETPGDVTPDTFSHAVQESWDNIRQSCRPDGGIEHEINTPVEVATHHRTPDVETTYRIVDVAGHPQGRIAAEKDGAISICIHGDCHTDFRTQSAQERQAILAAIHDIYPTVGYHVVSDTQEETR